MGRNFKVWLVLFEKIGNSLGKEYKYYITRIKEEKNKRQLSGGLEYLELS